MEMFLQRLLRFVVLSFIYLSMTPSFAQTPVAAPPEKPLNSKTDKLPRGAPPSVILSATPEPAPSALQNSKNPFDKLICHDYLASPVWDNIMMGGDELYYLARIGKEGDKYNYAMFIVYRDPKGLQIKKVFTVVGNETSVVLPHGIPAKGFSVLSFDGPSLGCGTGTGSGVSIPTFGWSAGSRMTELRKPRQTIRNGRYRVLDASYGRMLFDMQSSQIKEIDVDSFQQRITLKLSVDELPLYNDVGRKRIYVYDYEEGGRSLYRYKSLTKQIDDRIILNQGIKMINQENAFGLLTFEVKTNTLQITELPGWSAAIPQKVESKIALPSKYAVVDAGIVPSFESNVAVVFGNSTNARLTWKQVFVYDYSLPLKLTELNIAAADQLEGIALDRKGKNLFIAVRNGATKLHKALYHYDFEKKQWTDINLK